MKRNDAREENAAKGHRTPPSGSIIFDEQYWEPYITDYGLLCVLPIIQSKHDLLLGDLKSVSYSPPGLHPKPEQNQSKKAKAVAGTDRASHAK